MRKKFMRLKKLVPTCSQGKCKKMLTYQLIGGISMLALSASALSDTSFVNNARLPTNAQTTCVADVASWFTGGTVIANGWVSPANSLNSIFADYDNNTLCDFYKWGSQMFLWLTSGNRDQHVFNTAPNFYNVSVESDKTREFLAENALMNLAVRDAKTDEEDEEIEVGQAGGNDILISQNSSLVYYGIHANDVFALYTTGQKNGAFTSDASLNNSFPSTSEQLDTVSNYAITYGYPLGPDMNALAMELKTSWVDASTLANPNNYILSEAIVPVFDSSLAKGPWPVTGNEQKTLALVGMHIVGSVNGHPEMIWTTIEQVDNVPDNAYVYTTTSGSSGSKGYDSSGTNWQFLPQGAAQPTAITANATVETATDGTTPVQIVNQNGADIGPVDVQRVNPWGALPGNQADTAVGSNSDLISINTSVLSQLSTGDIRGNYIQTGGIWTVEGQIPTGGTDSELRGSLYLANTTMETFHQYSTGATGFDPQNCFACHSSTSGSTAESHIFKSLQALPKK
jgi:hypothetical protein